MNSNVIHIDFLPSTEAWKGHVAAKVNEIRAKRAIRCYADALQQLLFLSLEANMLGLGIYMAFASDFMSYVQEIAATDGE